MQTLPKVMHPRWQVAELELNLPSISDFSAHALPTCFITLHGRVKGIWGKSHLLTFNMFRCALLPLRPARLNRGLGRFSPIWAYFKT